MNKRTVMPLLVLLLIISFVNAVQVTEIQAGLETNSEELARLNADLSAKMSSMEQKFDTLLTEQEMTNLLNGSLQIQQQLLDNFRMLLTISFILILLAGLGLGYSIFFYYKSKGRI